MSETPEQRGAKAPELRDALEAMTLSDSTLQRVEDVAAVALGLRDALRRRQVHDDDAPLSSLLIVAAIICNTANRSGALDQLARQIAHSAERVQR